MAKTSTRKNPFEDKPFTSGGTPAPEKNVSGETKGVTIPGFNPVMPGQTARAGESRADVPAATTKNSTVDTTPRIIRDASGKSIGVQIPGEKEITGLKTKEISELIAGYYNSNARQQAVSKNQALAQQTEVDPAQAARIGEFSQQYNEIAGQGSELTGNIIENMQSQQAERNIEKFTGGVGLNDINGVLTRLVNKQTGGSGTVLFNSLVQSRPALKAYFSGYSNENNYNAVKGNIDNAKLKITESLALAKQPGQADIAIDGYNRALAQLKYADQQLKIIGSTDPGAFTSKIVNDRADIEYYFRELKEYDDIALGLAIGVR